MRGTLCESGDDSIFKPAMWDLVRLFPKCYRNTTPLPMECCLLVVVHFCVHKWYGFTVSLTSVVHSLVRIFASYVASERMASVSSLFQPYSLPCSGKRQYSICQDSHDAEGFETASPPIKSFLLPLLSSPRRRSLRGSIGVPTHS
jgi:hypothetical protein